MFYVSISTTACLYAIYLLKFLVPLYPSCRSSCQPRISRVISLTTTVSPGLVTAKSLSQFFLIFYLPVLVGCLPQYLMVHCGCRHPPACLSGAASPLSRPWSNAAGGVSPPRVFPRHPLPQNGNLDEKKNEAKTSAAVWILVPRGPRGQSLLSSRHPWL